MISRLAKETIQQWQKEGLKPSFEDIIKLNTLGLKVEFGSSSYEFGAVPRMAFLGDYVFHEPTVAKRIWIEQAQGIFVGDYINQLFLTAYALNCPSKELPELTNVKSIVREVEKFRDEVLLQFTETQIVACLEYALRGDDSDFNDEGVETEDSNPKELPQQVLSASRQVLMEALSYGMNEGVKDCLTLPQLEKVVMLAALHSGVDVLKGEHGQDVGRFYQACGKIHERLVKDGTLKEDIG